MYDEFGNEEYMLGDEGELEEEEISDQAEEEDEDEEE